MNSLARAKLVFFLLPFVHLSFIFFFSDPKIKDYEVHFAFRGLFLVLVHKRG